MNIALPHQTVTEYLRDFFFGRLALFCAGLCPLCGNRIQIIGLRLRMVMEIPLYRGRCRSDICRAHFTFLPLFVAPAKWHGYVQIEAALVYLAERKTTLTSALASWENEREMRIEEGRPAGPSVSTLRRWWGELAEASSDRVWWEQAVDHSPRHWPRPITGYGPDGILGEALSSGSTRRFQLVNPVPLFQPGPSSSFPNVPVPAVGFLFCLLSLAQAFLPTAVSPTISCLGIGIWTLESVVGRRLLASVDLVGRVIPGPSPFLTVTRGGARVYYPEPP